MLNSIFIKSSCELTVNVIVFFFVNTQVQTTHNVQWKAIWEVKYLGVRYKSCLNLGLTWRIKYITEDYLERTSPTYIQSNNHQSCEVNSIRLYYTICKILSMGLLWMINFLNLLLIWVKWLKTRFRGYFLDWLDTVRLLPLRFYFSFINIKPLAITGISARNGEHDSNKNESETL